MIVLGVDPGSRVTGYGVIETTPAGERLIDFGVLRLNDADDHPLKLKTIHERLLEVIDQWHPDVCAIEMPVYAQNAQSMLKLGRAQAAAMLSALVRQVPVVEYTPKEVKKSVTGNGSATKEQVGYMVRTILAMRPDADLVPHDASDALAVSICHAHRSARGVKPGSGSSWKRFIAENPDRVK